MADEADEEEILTVAGLRVRNSDALVERLDDPQTVASLLNLLDVLPTLSGTLTLLAGFYENSEHILDNARVSLMEAASMVTGTPAAQAAGTVAKLGKQALPLAGKVADSNLLGTVADSGVIDSVAKSGLLEKAADPELLATLGALVDAVGTARAEAAHSDRKIGVLGLASALKDPDVNRGVDFALRVLKELGASLKDAPNPTQNHKH